MNINYQVELFLKHMTNIIFLKEILSSTIKKFLTKFHSIQNPENLSIEFISTTAVYNFESQAPEISFDSNNYNFKKIKWYIFPLS